MGSRAYPVIAILVVLVLQYTRTLILDHEVVYDSTITRGKGHDLEGNTTRVQVKLSPNFVEHHVVESDHADWANDGRSVYMYPMWGINSDQMRVLIKSRFNYFFIDQWANGRYEPDGGFFKHWSQAEARCGGQTLDALVADGQETTTTTVTSTSSSTETKSPTASPTDQPTASTAASTTEGRHRRDVETGVARIQRDTGSHPHPHPTGRPTSAPTHPEANAKFCTGLLRRADLWYPKKYADNKEVWNTDAEITNQAGTENPRGYKWAAQQVDKGTHISDSCIIHMQFMTSMQYIFVVGLFFYLFIILLANMFGFNDGVHMVLDFATVFILLCAGVLAIVDIVSTNYVIWHGSCVVQSIDGAYNNLYEQTEAGEFSGSETGAGHASIAMDILTITVVVFVSVYSLWAHGDLRGPPDYKVSNALGSVMEAMM